MLGWRGLEPHITLKAPCGLGREVEWLSAVQQICQATSAFPIEVSRPAAFGDNVLYLRVTSPDLITLHTRLLNELGISRLDQEMCFEGPRYLPHLTLLQREPQGHFPMEEQLAMAGSYFLQDVSFQAKELLVYCKREDDAYVVIKAIPLGNNLVTPPL
ncbi:2'-5' RNA ligase family protein [Hymenobacter sp. BT635]|uniref:2'-5' RNA ligase family protein n=1 Tax=Hymenobacter nitidus TaxID=2880929 RepID=A0ABS8AM97_9BACT|nr:2'-5' RNA ligase family protein [Hymenobacter nitidus]